MGMLAQARGRAGEIQNFLQLVNALGIRALMHTIDKGREGIPGESGDGFVGEEHEILNHALRFAALGNEDFLGLAPLVEHKFRLGEIKIHAAPIPAATAQELRKAAHFKQGGAHIGADKLFVALEEAVDPSVGQTGAGADDGAGEAMVAHLSRGRYVHH